MVLQIPCAAQDLKIEQGKDPEKERVCADTTSSKELTSVQAAQDEALNEQMNLCKEITTKQKVVQ